MRRGASFLLLVLLAGCAGPSQTREADLEPIRVTDPGDYTYVTDSGNRPHLHDYWADETQIELVRDTHQAIVGLGGVDTVVASFQPPGRVVVPQGTAQVLVTVSWRPEPTDLFDHVELWVRNAADNQTRPVADLDNGVQVRVASTNEANDLPHQELSAWLFEVRMSPPDDVRPMRYRGTVTLEADAVRGLDIPLYPGHPDQWTGRDEIPLLSYQHEEPVWLYENNLCTGGCLPSSHALESGAVVPHDYGHVLVTLNVDASTPNTLGLLVHGGDTREFERLEPARDQGGLRTYEIRGLSGDGAYARQSMWDFAVVVEGGPGEVFSGSYAIEAVVHRAS